MPVATLAEFSEYLTWRLRSSENISCHLTIKLPVWVHRAIQYFANFLNDFRVVLVYFPRFYYNINKPT